MKQPTLDLALRDIEVIKRQKRLQMYQKVDFIAQQIVKPVRKIKQR